VSTPKKRPERTRHPTLWTVEALRWEFRKHETEYERLLAKKGEEGPGVQLGQRIALVDVEDRDFALAIAHHLLDRHAEEAAGRMSLEIHVHPPEHDVEDENAYKVSDEVLEQARNLGSRAMSSSRSSVWPGTPRPTTPTARRTCGMGPSP
jgi:hypothetical protein